jgi:quinolinate synthase
VATEVGIIHQMKKAEPGKNFIPAPPEDESCSCNECPYMKLNTMEKLYFCMENKFPEIVLDPIVAKKALIPIQRMLEMS